LAIFDEEPGCFGLAVFVCSGKSR